MPQAQVSQPLYTRPWHKHGSAIALFNCNPFLPLIAFLPLVSLVSVSDLAPGQSGMDDMKLLEQRAEQLAAEAERDQPQAKEKILFVR